MNANRVKDGLWLQADAVSAARRPRRLEEWSRLINAERRKIVSRTAFSERGDDAR